MRSPITPLPHVIPKRHAPLAILWIIAATCLVLDLAVARDATVALTTIPLFIVAALGTRRAVLAERTHAHPAR